MRQFISNLYLIIYCVQFNNLSNVLTNIDCILLNNMRWINNKFKYKFNIPLVHSEQEINWRQNQSKLHASHIIAISL